MSTFKTERELDNFVAELLKKSSVNEASEERNYKTDAERREMVRELRKVEAEEKDLIEAGNTTEAAQKHKEAQQLIDQLFYEAELSIYSLADALTSGPKSKRSGHAGSAYIHNTEEDLKAVGVKEFIRVIEGGEITDKNGTRKTGFDPDGPGTFLSFVSKCVEGVMKNCHTKEKKHRDEISLDAPRGDNDEEENDTNLYNNIFADSSLRFDKIGDDRYEQFLQSDAFAMVMDCLGDITQNKRDIEVLKHYYGVDGFEKLTPTQIGEKYGFSKQRANNIINILMAKLRDYFAKERRILNSSVDENERFLLKVGDKFASSPLSKLTSNQNLAGIIYGKDQLDALKKYWESKTSDKLVEIPWEKRSEVIGESSEEEKIESSLNGKTLSQARKAIDKLWGKEFSGIFGDTYWRPVNQFFDKLRDARINFELVRSEYHENSDGNPSNKEWKLEFKFKNQNDKEVSIFGTVTASGAGSVEYPLDKYDLVFQCF